MEQEKFRAVDRARATQMVVSKVVGDVEMFAVALQQTVEDADPMAVTNVMLVLAEELAGLMVDAYGDDAAGVLRRLLAQQLVEAGEA